MAETQITDLVPQETIDKVLELDKVIKTLLDDYTKTAKELAKGVDINVKVIGDIDKLEQQLVNKSKEAAATQQRLNTVLGEQKKVISETTNVVARQLMEQERVNKTQREAYTEHDKVKKLLEKFHDTYEEQARKLTLVNESLKENKNSQKNVEDLLKNGHITYERYLEMQTEITTQHRSLTQEKRALTQIMTAEEKMMQSADDSYASMSQKLELLKKAYKGLGEETKSTDLGEELETTIQNLDAHLKDLAADMGEHQRNVGNYAIANGSLKKDLKELVLEISTLTLQYQSLSAEEKASADGQALASHISDLTERAGILKDAISDTNAAITNAASDTRGFDQFAAAIQLAIDGFGLATGAAEMLGISEGELAEIQTKLQAAIAASNAMSKIQNALQKQSALSQAAVAIQTKLRAKAEALNTAAQGKGVIATKALTVAQWAFNQAANANPIGLTVVGLTAAIAAVWGLTKAFNAFFGSSAKVKESLKEQKKALEDFGESNDRELERMKARGASEEELHKRRLIFSKAEYQSNIKYFDAVKKVYKKDSDEYKEAQENKEKAKKKWDEEQENSYQYLLGIISTSDNEERKLKGETHAYKMQLIEQEFAEHRKMAEFLLKNDKIKKAEYEAMIASLEKAEKVKKDAVNADEYKKAAANAKKYAEELKNAVQAGQDALVNIISDSGERLLTTEELRYQRQLKSLNEQLGKLGANEKEKRQAINNQILALEVDHENKLALLRLNAKDQSEQVQLEILNTRLEYAKEGSAQEYQLKKDLLGKQESLELNAIEKRLLDGTLKTEEAEQLRTAIVQKYAKLRADAENGFIESQAEQIQNRYGAEEIMRNHAYGKELADLKERYAKELAMAGGNTAKREKIERKFENDMYNLQFEYAQKSAQASIDMIEKILSLEGMSAEDRMKWEKELADAKINLSHLVSEKLIHDDEDQAKKNKEVMEARKAAISQWLQYASEAIEKVNDLVNTLFDNQINRIEEEQEANTAAGEAEQDRISQLVEKKVITEEEGEARKRAAEAQTAKKNEELERKKAQLKHKQALWDKANSLAQAGISTALAITQSYPNLIQAAIVAALGAIQIATIAATPIPKYAKGTDYHKGGPAIVGDGGRPEVVIFGNQSWITPDTPTLVDIPRGASVIPSVNDPGLRTTDYLPSKNGGSFMPIPYNDSNIIRRINELVGVTRQMAKQQHRDARMVNYLADFELLKLRLQ